MSRLRASDTDTRQMSMVFASETLRFYFACGEYSDFLHHCVRYMLSFLDEHHPVAGRRTFCKQRSVGVPGLSTTSSDSVSSSLVSLSAIYGFR